MDKIQIAIIDDDPVLVEHLKFLLAQPEHRLQVVAVFSGVDTFFDYFLEKAPKLDVILLDLDLGGALSIPHISRLKRLTAPARIVIVTGYEDDHMLTEAVEAGADGYFVKRPRPKPSLPEIIRITHEGGAFLEPSLSASLLRTLQNRKSPLRSVNIAQIAKRYSVTFTKREIEVLDGLLEEYSYQEIGDRNHISINTVRHYVKLLYQKLRVNSRRELMDKVMQA